jgi:hypothetical protein
MSEGQIGRAVLASVFLYSFFINLIYFNLILQPIIHCIVQKWCLERDSLSRHYNAVDHIHDIANRAKLIYKRNFITLHSAVIPETDKCPKETLSVDNVQENYNSCNLYVHLQYSAT